MESIISTERKCFICGKTVNLQVHHCWHGSNRKKADRDGLTVNLCFECHSKLHDKGEGDRYLMEIAERAWLKSTGGTVKDFIERYGKNLI